MPGLSESGGGGGEEGNGDGGREEGREWRQKLTMELRSLTASREGERACVPFWHAEVSAHSPIITW